MTKIDKEAILPRVARPGIYWIYEIGAKITYPNAPRWGWNLATGWMDRGYTGLVRLAEVLTIQDGAMLLHLHDVVLPINQKFFVPIENTFGIGHIYKPEQWDYPGFFQPDGGWEYFAPQAPTKICSCGAEAYAKLTNSPVSGHGVYCQMWEKNPYAR